MGALASRKSENLTLLLALLAADDLPLPTLHYRFAKPRRWAFDLAYVTLKIALEVEGGIWIQGRHTRGLGFENDLRKYNAAVLDGWLLLRVSYGMVGTGEALEAIHHALNLRQHDGDGNAA